MDAIGQIWLDIGMGKCYSASRPNSGTKASAGRVSDETTNKARIAFHHMSFRPHFYRLIGGIAIALFLGGLSLHAATLPAGFVETQYGANVGSNPTAMEFAPDGRLFVCLQGGQLRVISNGTLLTTPFVTVTTIADGERGLLGSPSTRILPATSLSTSTTPSSPRRSTTASAVSPRMGMWLWLEARRLFLNSMI